MLDSFHLFRSGGSVVDIAAISPAWLRYAQFCDAPATSPATMAGTSEEARFERLMPSDGGLPLREFLAALPVGIPLGLEAPMRRMSASVGAVERARRALLAARRLAEAIPHL